MEQYREFGLLVGWWVKIDLTRTNQVERQSRRQILTQASARFEQNYQFSARADILPLALAFVFVRRPLGRAMLVCVFVFVFVLYLSLPFPGIVFL